MEKHTTDPSSTPVVLPHGFVGRDEAARITGIGITAWNRWETEGKISCGQWLARPRGGRVRIYPVDAIRQMMQDLNMSFPPPGMVDLNGACRMFGIAPRTFSTWEKEGRIRCGQLVSVPGKPGQHKVYPAEELRLLAGEAKNVPPFPSPGFIGRHEARRIFGVSLTTWTVWERNGRITCGHSVPIPGKPGRCKVYPIDELQRLKAEVDRQAQDAIEQAEPYADPHQPGVVRVPVLTEKHKGMEAIINSADLPLVQGKRWNWSPSKSGGGTVVLAMTGTPKPSLTRIILGLEDREQLVCHRNDDRLDCRRENLVVRTRSQVKRAAKKVRIKNGRACSSQFKGVIRTTSGRKWAAMINVGGEYRNLGRFRSEVDAALAYDNALRELMGEEVAGLNFPNPADAERLRALEPTVEDGPFPPPGMVDRHEACRLFGVSLTTWIVWERRGRITCGQYHSLPNDKPGRCKLYPKEELERARVEIEKLGKPYPDPDRQGIWRVPLKSYLTYREALIDEADLPIIEGKNWNWAERDDENGKMDGVVVLATMERATPLHRMIAGITDPATRVCFVNGDALDCRRANLVVRTLAETIQTNRKMETRAGKECTSRFKGVCFQPGRGKWVAQIRKGEVGKNIGRFDDELAAAEAYDDCARVWFGDHAYLNFPDRESTEANRLWAQRVMDGTAAKERLRRRRLRKLERKLKRAVLEVRQAERARTQSERDAEDAVSNQAPSIRRSIARKLFGVPRSIWKRWRRFGWLPESVLVDGKKRYRLADIERLLRLCGRVVLPYPDPQLPDTYRVPLNGETAKGREALIDADSVPLVQGRRWRFASTDTGRGGEVQTMNPSENIRLHYVVMGIASNKEHHIGFRNDDPLDCRRENLVVRTLSDTHANQRKQATFRGRPCTSRFKGVFKEKRRERWVATIKKNRVQMRLGTFRDEIAAAQAYDEAARELFGEHARLNFPNGIDMWLERAAA